MNHGVNVDINAWNFYINQLGNFSAVIGDFNAHHPLWSFNDKRNPSGEAIFQLLSTSDLCLLTPPRLVTYVDFARGTKSTLDLCIVSSALVSNSSVTTGPDLGSDHYSIEVLMNKQPLTCEVKVWPKWKLEGVMWKEWAKKATKHK